MIRNILSALFISALILATPVKHILAEDTVATQSAQTQEDQSVTSNASNDSDQHEAPNEQASIDNDNKADISSSVDEESDTGNNIASQDIITTEISTGDAVASASAHTDVNTNITGESIEKQVVHVEGTTSGDISIASKPTTCDGAPQQSSVVSNTNEANITNDIVVDANTGENDSKGIISAVETGDATASAHLSTIANTNLTGECGYLGIVNVYDDHTGNVMLPDDRSFVGSAPASREQSHAETTNQNQAQVSGTVIAAATTGDNNAQVIDTGSGTVTVRQLDVVNTNITGDDWLMVRVNNASLWNGTFIGWDGNMYRDNDYALAWTQLPSGSSGFGTVTNTNNATVTNNVTVRANTGGNSASGILSSVRTGKADAEVDIFNMANTNITGMRWFYVLVNLFGHLNGDIVFPRVNLAISVSADRSNVRHGDESVVTVTYANHGTKASTGTLIEVPVSQSGEITAVSAGGTIEGNTLRWRVGSVTAGGSGAVWFRVRLTTSQIPSSIWFSASTNSDQPDLDANDNSASVTFTIYEAALQFAAPAVSQQLYQPLILKVPVTAINKVPKNASVGTSVLGASENEPYVYTYDGLKLSGIAKVSTMYEGDEPRANAFHVVIPAIVGSLFLAVLQKYSKRLLFE